jgi:hypothetical protein
MAKQKGLSGRGPSLSKICLLLAGLLLLYGLACIGLMFLSGGSETEQSTELGKRLVIEAASGNIVSGKSATIKDLAKEAAEK